MDATGLYRLLAEISSSTLEEAQALGAMLLALPPGQEDRHLCRSTLNNDGSPLQLCLTSSKGAPTARLLGDPGSFVSTLTERLGRSREAVAALSTAIGCEPIDSLTDRILRSMLPVDCAPTAEACAGVLWLAAGMRERGAAVYINARWNTPEEDWLSVLRLLQSILPRVEYAATVMRELRGKTRIASISLETTTSGDIRIKIYWRLLGPTALSSFSIALLRHPALLGFLTAAASDCRLPVTGLVFSTGFLLSTGELVDVKADVCAHCVRRSLPQWLDLVDEITDRNRLARITARDCSTRDLAEVAYLGFGVRRDDDVRLNLYLKSANAR